MRALLLGHSGGRQRPQIVSHRRWRRCDMRWMGSGLLVIYHEPVVPVVALHDRRCTQTGAYERGRRGFRTPRGRRFGYWRGVSTIAGEGLGRGLIVETLWLVLAGRTFTEGRTVGRGQVESGPETIVLLLEFGNAQLESLQMCGSSSTKCSLDVSRSVRRKVIVSFATTLGGHG